MGFGGQFGYYKDGATGLYLLTHRYYDAGAGRFLTRDPIGYGGGMNLYGYAEGNPVNESDPSGFQPGPGPYSGPGIDWERVGAWASRYLNAGNMRRAVNYAARANAEENLTPTVQMTPSVNSGASPNARAAEEENAEVERVSVGALRRAGRRDAHHIIQDAAVRDLPGYRTNDAPGIQLRGPANDPTTPHGRTRPIQQQVGGGTYAAERRIGYKTLRRAGVPRAESRSHIRNADRYFAGLGVGPATPTRPVGDRRR